MDVALIKSGAVAQVWRDAEIQNEPPAEGEAWTGLNPDDYPDGTLVAFDAAEHVVCGMAWDGEALSVPVPVPTADDLMAYLADKRYRVEVGGIVFNGVPCWTDRATQSMLQRASYMLDKGMLTAPIKVKIPAGFALLSEVEINAIGTAVGLHVQACFDREADLAAAIAAETITTYAEIETADWPSNA